MSTLITRSHHSLQTDRLAPRARSWREPLIKAAFGLKNPGFLPELALIESVERSPQRLKAVQQERLEALLHHAWSRTDYYHDALEACGAVRNGRVDLDRFDRIPFLTKDIIRKEGERLRAKSLPGGRRSYANRSSGTSGQPIDVWQDNAYWDATIATRTYHFSLAGKRLGEREMKIWGNDRDLYTGTIGLKARIENWVYNRRFEQCFHMPESRMRTIIRHINEWRPRMLFCYRDGVYALAQYVNKHRIALCPPRSVVLGGSTVYPFMREEIAKAFGCSVISAYGSREVGAAACECLKGEGHHLATQTHVIEAIGADERPVMEAEGELAITPLLNYAMPLIRYRIGDRGRLTARRCSCGRAFPLMDQLSGRVFEAMVNRKGEHVDGGFIVYVLAFMAERGYVRKFQVIQEPDCSITINVVLTGSERLEAHAKDLDALRAKIQFVMGEDCPVRFVPVADIPTNASGKFPYVLRRGTPTAAQAA